LFQIKVKKNQKKIADKKTKDAKDKIKEKH
jgi:hypothetical protein